MVPGQRVEVYRNLHKGKKTGEAWYSVRQRSGKRHVIGHVQNIVLEDCKLVVSEAGRQRCLREKRKNVHAVIRGTISAQPYFYGLSLPVTYNPYKYSSFVFVDSYGQVTPVHAAKRVGIAGKSVVVR